MKARSCMCLQILVDAAAHDRLCFCFLVLLIPGRPTMLGTSLSATMLPRRLPPLPRHMHSSVSPFRLRLCRVSMVIVCADDMNPFGTPSSYGHHPFGLRTGTRLIFMAGVKNFHLRLCPPQPRPEICICQTRLAPVLRSTQEVLSRPLLGMVSTIVYVNKWFAR